MAKRGGILSKLSVSDLHREIRKRQKRVGPMMKKRATLAAKIEALDAEIAALGGGHGGSIAGVRKRPHNELNLVQSLAKLLDGKTMNVTEIARKVQDAGYKTTSPSFRTIVNQTLINQKSTFKRVGRGLYTVK